MGVTSSARAGRRRLSASKPSSSATRRAVSTTTFLDRPRALTSSAIATSLHCTHPVYSVHKDEASQLSPEGRTRCLGRSDGPLPSRRSRRGGGESPARGAPPLSFLFFV